MVIHTHSITARVPRYAGLRMTVDEYARLEDDGFRYELIDGVVVLSPIPSLPHQEIVLELSRQLANFLCENRVGAAASDVDVHLTDKLCYRPDMVFIRAERRDPNWVHVEDVPDMVCEIISPSYRQYDAQTKRGDYERFGVREYWLIDPEQDAMTFYRLGEDGKYAEAAIDGEQFRSEAVPGFALDLKALRKSFRPG